MKVLKVFAPFSGVVQKIEKITDNAFASKALGDGVFIVPDNNVMLSPLEKAKLELIADTKHAYYFQQDEINLLVHVGLETVNLEGRPFKLISSLGDTVNLKTKIVEIDKTEISDNISLETPIVIEVNEFKEYKINFKKDGKRVEQGELLYELEYLKKEVTSDQIVKIDREINKYETIASQILQAIGGVKNQTNVFNCMTRLRFKIINKDLVDEKLIKQISIVKGINWAGEELQIIIGGEVHKVRQECSNLIENKNDQKTIENKKIPFKNKIAPALTSILFPTIPLLIGTGIIGGIQAILVVAGVLKNPSPTLPVSELDIFSVLFYVGSKVGIELIGVAFLYSTVKYLKGETPMAILLALLLTSRYLMGSGWVLFQLFGNDISIKSYESSVLPMIAAGFLVHYMNVWTKKWMPSSIDVVFRTAFVVFSSFLIIMFTVGPFFRIIEQILSKFVMLLGDIPYGLGLGIFAMLWQALVLTGTHVAIVTAISLPMTNEQLPSVMYSALQIAIVGQMGAAIAVAIRTKNNKIKQTAWGGMPGAVFGITEPLIYGVNLRKFWPFIYGSLGALIGGTVGGMFGLAQISRTGTGVMSYIGLGVGKNLIVGLIASLIALTSGFAITVLLYVDRKTEVKEFKKVNKTYINLLLKSKQISKKNEKIIEINDKLAKIGLKIKGENNYKQYEEVLISLSNKEIKLQKMNDKFTFKKDLMFKKAEKLKSVDIEKYNEFAIKYNNFVKGDNFELVENQIKQLNVNLEAEVKKYKNFTDEILKEIYEIIDNKDMKLDKQLTTFVKDKYYNALNIFEINYEINDEKTIDYKVLKLFYKEMKVGKINVK
ncbi:PTS system, beta-glucoside-specific IIA component [Spiroplasma chinense]|uniref:PTS system, beta-glucoside-specific IIA component n=1 Tax=Spiroplasma chinense TaxID=216932 RepID=A0A5B9Y5I6_9MOLU|nr:PTS glucose transporter subunit IIA [Spiroplasma chinense]QEH61959.1 PTS system, beta-glucoside-specific IIA component [Spiroplasma chinense]